jgi:hypothetical protein
MRTGEDYPVINDPIMDYYVFSGWAIYVSGELSAISTTGECPFCSDTTLHATYTTRTVLRTEGILSSGQAPQLVCLEGAKDTLVAV